MKTFMKEKFYEDLMVLRGKDTQEDFLQKLGISSCILELIESGSQLPNEDVLSRFCTLNNKMLDEYFEMDVNYDNVSYLLDKLELVDREKFKKMLERMNIVDKYELLARRSSYVDC